MLLLAAQKSDLRLLIAVDHIQWATQSIERDPSTFNYAPRASPVKTQGILSYNLLVLLFTQGKLYQLSFVSIRKLICESDLVQLVSHGLHLEGCHVVPGEHGFIYLFNSFTRVKSRLYYCQLSAIFKFF